MFKRINPYLQIVSVLLIAMILNGCTAYNLVDVKEKDTFLKLDPQQKLFIVQAKDKEIYLTNVSISLDGVKGTRLDALESTYQPPQKIYLAVNKISDTWTINQPITIPLSSITQIKIYDIDLGWTLVNISFGVLTTILILGVIAMALKKSCPLIYSFDGKQYVFSGEIYSGAIYPPLERHDYLTLNNIQPSGNNYLLKIANKMKEIQHTNLVELMVFDHPQNEKVLLDKYGHLHTLQTPVIPQTAYNSSGETVLPQLVSKDSQLFMGNISENITTVNMTKEALFLTFKKPLNVHKAKLIVHAKNSYWLDHVFGQFSQLFGSAYPQWMELQKKGDCVALKKWALDQGFPLAVYVKKEGKFHLQDYFEIAGSLAMKDDILELDLSGINSDQVEVKLEFGFYAWEIDYTAMDFTPDHPLPVQTIPLKSAIDQNQQEVSERLRHEDNQYYDQPHIGDYALLTFEAPTQNVKMRRTVILHSKGHYEILQDISGQPNASLLEEFKTPGRFIQFSKEKFLEFRDQIINK